LADEAAWTVTPIRKEHVRDRFESGEAALDAFLHLYARQNQDRDLGRTYVATRPGQLEVLGYFTVRSGSILFDALPADEAKRLPHYPIPVVHLGRLAVDRRAQGSGLGGRLLAEALRIAMEVSASLAIYAVEVIAKSEAARTVYERYGFRSLSDDRLHLYISMKTVRKVFR
jgi:GNAT superfamily N-acetyltransferase